MSILYRALLSGLLLGSPAATLFAQKAPADDSNPSLVNSGEALKQGLRYYESGSYKKAIESLLKVQEGDTNYTTALYELIQAYVADSNFEAAKPLAFRGLQQQDADRRDYLFMLGHIYDYLQQPDSALYYYDSTARINPHDNMPYYEKGVVYFMQQQYDQALQQLQQSLLRNPYHFRSHLMLGTIYARQGRLSEAMMALQASLLMTTNKDVARASINLIDEIAAGSEETNSAFRQKKAAYKHRLFDETDQIISARLALNRAYKVRSRMDDERIVRQSQVLFEKLVYDPADSNFAMQYYVPMMAQVYHKGLFDPFMLLLFSGYEIESVERHVKKEQSRIDEAKTFVFPYLSRILATRVLHYDQRKKAEQRFHAISREEIYIAGSFQDPEKTTFKAGPASYYKRGSLTARGLYNDAGKKEGVWEYYFRSGRLSKTETFSNGKLHGPVHAYYANGNQRYYARYEQGDLKEEKEFRYNGPLHLHTLHTGPKRKTLHYYYANGQKEMSLDITGDEIADGPLHSSHRNGLPEQELTFAGGKKHGPYKSWYETGGLKEEGFFEQGKRSGLWTLYHRNGQVSEKNNYKAGEFDGSYEEFDDQGRLSDSGAFKAGKRHGTQRLFTPSGHNYCTITFKEGVPVGVRNVAEDGKVILEQSGSPDVLRTFYENGNRRSELPYQDGRIHGLARYYHKTGALRETNTYKNGRLNGPATKYYKAGGKSLESHYRDGQLNGYYRSYFTNGNTEAEGWMVDGKKNGLWKQYHPNGKPERSCYYVSGDRNGPLHFYNIDGRLEYTDHYDRDMLVAVSQYDDAGNTTFHEAYPQGNGHYRMRWPNGVAIFECDMKHGLYHGPYRKLTPAGKLLESGTFKHGYRDSSYLAYHYNGQLRVKGSYRNGQQHGLWQYYDMAGQLDKETHYVNGDAEGTERLYAGGLLRSEHSMRGGQRHGRATYYGENKKTACVLEYEQGNLTAYSWEGPDGRLLPMKPVKNGTARIESYFANGAKSAELQVVENIFSGRQVFYYSNGRVAEERHYEHSDLSGPFKQYYPSGQPYYDAVFVDDVLNGEEQIFSADGRQAGSRTYMYGYLHGAYTFTAPAGKKPTQLQFRYGRLTADSETLQKQK